MRRRTIDSLRRTSLLVALLAGSALAATPPQSSTDAGRRPADSQSAGSPSNVPDNGALDDDADATPLPWSQLNPTQRSMLAPLQSQWDQLPPHRQQRMAAHAEHWMQLPPERRAQIQQHLARWAQMTPEQRRDAMHGEESFRSMPEADRQRVLDAYQRFQSLTPEQRRMLMHRFHEERRARHGMDDPHRTGDQGQPPQQQH
jgi:hypothetical protein